MGAELHLPERRDKSARREFPLRASGGGPGICEKNLLRRLEAVLRKGGLPVRGRADARFLRAVQAARAGLFLRGVRLLDGKGLPLPYASRRSSLLDRAGKQRLLGRDEGEGAAGNRASGPGNRALESQGKRRNDSALRKGAHESIGPSRHPELRKTLLSHGFPVGGRGASSRYGGRRHRIPAVCPPGIRRDAAARERGLLCRREGRSPVPAADLRLEDDGNALEAGSEPRGFPGSLRHLPRGPAEALPAAGRNHTRGLRLPGSGNRNRKGL